MGPLGGCERTPCTPPGYGPGILAKGSLQPNGINSYLLLALNAGKPFSLIG